MWRWSSSEPHSSDWREWEVRWLLQTPHSGVFCDPVNEMGAQNVRSHGSREVDGEAVSGFASRSFRSLMLSYLSSMLSLKGMLKE